MQIIEIAAQESGGHRNQDGFIGEVPAGWAVIPAGMDTPNFPFGDLTVDETQTPPVVTSWTPLPVPDDPPAEADELPAVEARLTALEAEAEQVKADREAINILLGLEA